MSAKKLSDNPPAYDAFRAGLRTWIEIDSRAARHNYAFFRKLAGPRVKLWSVVKSNAYGHGLLVFSRLMERFGVDGFCVDSLLEGIRMRKEGIQKPILVLGMTLPLLLSHAAERDVTVTISNFDALRALVREKNPPKFHLKIDTGMHRQGFYLRDLPRVVKFLSPSASGGKFSVLSPKLAGIYTHFASAKDLNYPTYTERQFADFKKARQIFARAGFRNLVSHCAATGAALLGKKYHLDAVRVGIGLYGLYPSKELEIQLPEIVLKPVLSWRTVAGEVKRLIEGDYVGYDLAERVRRPTLMAVLPVGYWHGFPRNLSSVGDVLVGGRRGKVLGRISMDLTTIDVTGVRCRRGDIVTLIGRAGKEEIKAFDAAQRSGTIHYEFLTRLNPLMERVVV